MFDSEVYSQRLNIWQMFPSILVWLLLCQTICVCVCVRAHALFEARNVMVNDPSDLSLSLSSPSIPVLHIHAYVYTHTQSVDNIIVPAVIFTFLNGEQWNLH